MIHSFIFLIFFLNLFDRDNTFDQR